MTQSHGEKQGHGRRRPPDADGADQAPTAATGDPESGAGGQGLGGFEPPENVGPYRILDTLGEGGFGVVYLAEQTWPVKRRAALKIIKPGMDSKAVIARFEAERQALAMMDHPCVARVFDAGTTAEGRPFFVMEHVHGVPITDHCDTHKLEVKERLELFIRVCEAIQHAHQKGVIHRDIKASNILVEFEDGKATPKVIDFGVAKAISQPLTERTIFTEQGQLIGTPEYMSPEQAAMTAQDIDTRSDIYALGVLLYELLTGMLPFDRRMLRSAGFSEIQRIIREIEPPRPSTRLSTLGDPPAGAPPARTDDAAPLSEVARFRATDPRTLLRSLRGDLDWIVMKCLEKDRTRRYETANGLGMDIRRYLDHEPVLAGPPGAAYRFRKFARRNQGTLTAAAAVAAALVLGLALATHESIQARRERDRALEAEGLARAAAARSERVLESIGRMFETFKPAAAGADWHVLVELLDQAAQSAAQELTDEPEAQAELMSIIARRFESFQAWPYAVVWRSKVLDVRRKILAHDVPALCASLDELGHALRGAGELSRAERFGREAIELARNLWGDDHKRTADYKYHFGDTLMDIGKYSEAEELFLDVLEFNRRADEERVPTSLHTLSWVAQARGDLANAERYLRDYLGLSGDGISRSALAHAKNSLAAILRKQARYEEALTLCRESLSLVRQYMGVGHPREAGSLLGLGVLQLEMGLLDEAEQNLYHALEIWLAAVDDKHPSVASAKYRLSAVLAARGRLHDAEELARAAADAKRQDHPDLAFYLSQLGRIMAAQGKAEEAERLFREALHLGGDEIGRHPVMARTLANLAALLVDQGRLGESESLLEQAFEIQRLRLDEDHPDVARTLSVRAVMRGKAGDVDGAMEDATEALRICRARLGEDHYRLALVMADLGRLHLATGTLDDAESWLLDALEAHRRLLGSGHPQTGRVQSEYGECLTRLARFEEAEPVLLEAHSHLEGVCGADHPLTRAALERVVLLYEQWGRTEQADQWRSRLEKT